MALARYEGTAVNTAGDVIPNATVEVRRDQPGRPVVPLWADREGAVALGNPIQTDAQGGFAFHVVGGVYYIRIYTGPSQQPTFQKVLRYVGIGTAAERDVEDLASALETGTATFPTLAELEAFTPSDVGVGGKVTTGEDAGFYHYDTIEEEWVFDRPLYDTLARMNVTGGTADAIVAETATGVADSAVVMLWIEAPGDNTGPVTINGKEVLTAGGNSLIAGQWNEGRTYWFSDEGANYKLRTESDVDGIATQVEIWANETLDNKNYAEEWAQSDDPISIAAGGDGADDKSSKTWAGESEASAVLAAGYAAGVNLPPVLPGDAGKQLFVNDDEDGYVLEFLTTGVIPDGLITAPKLSDDPAELAAMQAKLGGNVSTPCGRLSLVAGTATPESDTASGTSIYYLPSGGALIPLYDGTSFKAKGIGSGLTLALDATGGHYQIQLANFNCDLFVFDHAGTIRLGSGPSWTQGAVAGSDVLRGTGATSTELESVGGFFVNRYDIVLRYGSGASDYVTVPARRATYVGSVRPTANGVATDTKAKRLLFNAYNQMPRPLKISGPSSWNYSIATFRQAGGVTTTQVEMLMGLAGIPVALSLLSIVVNSVTTFAQVRSAIGLDGAVPSSDCLFEVQYIDTKICSLRSEYNGFPGLGFHALKWLEMGDASATQTWYGEGGVGFRSGLTGQVIL